jgi:hypothetical protein
MYLLVDNDCYGIITVGTDTTCETSSTNDLTVTTSEASMVKRQTAACMMRARTCVWPLARSTQRMVCARRPDFFVACCSLLGGSSSQPSVTSKLVQQSGMFHWLQSARIFHCAYELQTTHQTSVASRQ